jgi:hypothetical protein
MMVTGLTAPEVLLVVEGIALRRLPVQRGRFWSLRVKARSRSERRAAYAAISARIVFTILSAVAQFERERIGERIAESKAHLKEQGRYLGGTRPFGSAIGPDGTLRPDAKEQRAITAMRAMKTRGASLRANRPVHAQARLHAEPRGGPAGAGGDVGSVPRSRVVPSHSGLGYPVRTRRACRAQVLRGLAATRSPLVTHWRPRLLQDVSIVGNSR